MFLFLELSNGLIFTWSNINAPKTSALVTQKLPISYTKYYSISKQYISEKNNGGNASIRMGSIYKIDLSQISFYNIGYANSIYNIITIGI